MTDHYVSFSCSSAYHAPLPDGMETAAIVLRFTDAVWVQGEIYSITLRADDIFVRVTKKRAKCSPGSNVLAAAAIVVDERDGFGECSRELTWTGQS